MDGVQDFHIVEVISSYLKISTECKKTVNRLLARSGHSGEELLIRAKKSQEHVLEILGRLKERYPSEYATAAKTE